MKKRSITERGVRALGATARGAVASGATSSEAPALGGGASALGAFAVGAAAGGAVAIGALTIRSLAIKRGKVGHLKIDELEVGRLRVRELISESVRDRPHPFQALEGHKYANLTTFRRSGEGVSTPVWFALVHGRIYVTTPPDSGKIKRIRNDPRVTLTPCNAWGKTLGTTVEGIARQLEDGEAPEEATAAFGRKYRFGLGVFHFFGAREIGTLTLEVSPAEPEEA